MRLVLPCVSSHASGTGTAVCLVACVWCRTNFTSGSIIIILKKIRVVLRPYLLNDAVLIRTDLDASAVSYPPTDFYHTIPYYTIGPVVRHSASLAQHTHTHRLTPARARTHAHTHARILRVSGTHCTRMTTMQKPTTSNRSRRRSARTERPWSVKADSPTSCSSQYSVAQHAEAWSVYVHGTACSPSDEHTLGHHGS